MRNSACTDSTDRQQVSISKQHIVSYMDTVRTGLFITLLYTLLSELFMFFVVRYAPVDFTSSVFFIRERWTADFAYFMRHIIVPNVLNWSAFAAYVIAYKRVGFHGKKFVSCAVYLFAATVYVFGHWGFIYLSILYVIPVVLATPMGRRSHNTVFFISLALQITYCLYQNVLIPSMYNILVALLSVAALVAMFFLTRCINNVFTSAISDIQKYAALSSELHDKVLHDELTGAFSRAALLEEEKNLGAYDSIAFIDLDDFKNINDTHGHEAGDNILKAVVAAFRRENILLYRYGGDEFVALTVLSCDELAEKMPHIKQRFSQATSERFGITAGFSAGVAPVVPGSSLAQLLEDSDKLMYTDKAGK